MAGGFVKLYGSILDSSVWSEDPYTRLVWITMLAMADAEGFIEAAVPGLARRANVPLEQCVEALARLQSPDPHSKSPDHEGRRIERAERGWRILNYRTYRELRTSEQVANAERQARFKASRRGVTGNESNAWSLEASASASASAVVPLGEGVGEGAPPDDRPADRFIRGSNFRAASDLDVKILQAVRQLVEATSEPPHVWMRRVTSYKRPDGTMTAGVEDPARLGSVLAREKALADAEWHLAEIAKERGAKRGA